MPELDPVQTKLIQKMTKASVMIEGLKGEHSDTCPVNDPHIPMTCRCGTDELGKKMQKFWVFLTQVKINF
jgi:hypothetical protein